MSYRKSANDSPSPSGMSQSPSFSAGTTTRKPAVSASAPNSTTGSSGTGKLPVSGPASFGKVASILLMHVCKRVLLIRTVSKLLVYLAVLCCVSLVTDHFPFPKTYLSDKRNFLNQYFVKLGWGWTCTIVGLFIYLTSHTYCCGERRAINRHLCRLAVATAWWYISVRIFDYVHDSVGMCSTAPPGSTSQRLLGTAAPVGTTDAAMSRDMCESTGRRWLAFDISGHTFLLIHCLLIISEEARAVGNGWERIDETLTREEQLQVLRLTADEISTARESNTNYSGYVRWLALAMTLLTLIWELMLLSTILYFHNLPQKLIGAGFAIVGWLATYRGWYQIDSALWSPGLPGRGRFKYLKD